MTSRDEAGEPFDLGVVGPAEPELEPAATAPCRRLPPGWRRWGALATAAAVGAVLGTVVADARDTTTSYSRVEVVGGLLEPVLTQPEARVSSTLVVSLLNAGRREIEILRVDADGFTIPAGARQPDPVAAAPGSWVRFTQTDLHADCDGPMPTTPELRVRVRVESGDEKVVSVTSPGNAELTYYWQVRCEITGYVFFEEPRSVVAGDSSTTLTLPISNRSRKDSRVSTLIPDSPGFEVTSPDLPRVVPAGETVAVDVTWTVNDCVVAQDLRAASIVFVTATESLDRQHTQDLGKRVLVELARLAERACGL